jgi:hypothetical protein
VERDEATFAPLPAEEGAVSAVEMHERMGRILPRCADRRCGKDWSLARSAERTEFVEILLRASWTHWRLLELAQDAENRDFEAVFGLAVRALDVSADELLGMICVVLPSGRLVYEPTAFAKPCHHLLKEFHHVLLSMFGFSVASHTLSELPKKIKQKRNSEVSF